MKLYFVTFDDTEVVAVERGLAVETDGERSFVDLGTDVGGATLAMIPFRIPLLEIKVEGEPGSRRVASATPKFGEDGDIWFVPDADAADARAFVVLSVIQRSPDARTEVAPFVDGVECVGNAYERPMDTQVLLMQPGTSVRFRRFGRGGQYGDWQAVDWDGDDLRAGAARESDA